MKLVVLGSGTCLGPAVAPPVGARVKPRLPPLFALDVAPPSEPPSWLLFDCSEGARWRLPEAGIDPRAVHHVAVTHPHADHAALPQFVQGRACEAIYRGGRESLGLAVYLPARAAATVGTLWSWHQPEDLGRATSRYALEVVAVGEGFAREVLPGVVLRAFEVFHSWGRSPAVAYRVEARGQVFVYSGDTGRCEGITRAARGADVFVCEAASRIGVDMSTGYGHLNPRQAGEVARDAGAKHTVLTHHTGDDSDEAMLADARASGYDGELSVAHDGDVLAW